MRGKRIVLAAVALALLGTTAIAQGDKSKTRSP